jgi:hypothetical protein
MTQGYTLLNDPLNAQSEAFVPLYSNAGAIINGSAACAAAYPQIQGFPTVVYQDASGNNHALYNPGTMAAVREWREAIDNPPPPPSPTVISRGDFLLRFTQAELVAIMTALPSDPELQAAKMLMEASDNNQVGLTWTTTTTYINYLVTRTPSILTQDRATTILTP